MRRIVIILVVLLLASGGLYYVFAGAQRPGEAPAPSGSQQVLAKMGAEAPDFTLRNLAGQNVSLSQYKGKVVVLNFWATWCAPCREEMPSMERLAKTFAGKDFAMLAVNVETESDARANVEKLLARQPHSFPVLFDSDGRVQMMYGVFKFPESYIIGKDGKILEKVIGGIDWATPQVIDYFRTLVEGE